MTRGMVWAFTLGMVLVSGVARAQYSVPAEASSGQRVGSARSKIAEELVRPGGWELGASLAFVTSAPSLGGESLDFTDIVYLRVHGLVAIGGKVELFGGFDILPKQPSYTDELIFQGGLVGGRVRLGERFAVWLRAAAGPQIGREGWWLSADSAVQYKHALEKILFWESALGVTYTQLFLDRDTDQAFWLTEIQAQTGIALRDPQGHFGAWVTFAFHFPIASGPDADAPDSASGLYLDPQTRVNLHIGALIAVAKSVDLFMEWSIIDRGDLEDPATTLPIIDGGFDQQQLVFGFMRRFGG